MKPKKHKNLLLALVGFTGAITLSSIVAGVSIYYLKPSQENTLQTIKEDINEDGIKDKIFFYTNGKTDIYIGQKDGSMKSISELPENEKLKLEEKVKNLLNNYQK